IKEAFDVSKLDTILVEEFIEGREFSIESLHYNGKSEVIQFTEKKTTEFPYNVELGHIQPANLTEEEHDEIRNIISKIAECMHFENCASHTELKINNRGVFVIETSPRLGGDYITSILTPLSTGINLEDQLIRISLGKPVDIGKGHKDSSSAVCFFSLPIGSIVAIDKQLKDIASWPGICDFQSKLQVGDKINKITSSLNRYGHFIVTGENRELTEGYVRDYEEKIKSFFEICE
ncbi:MAG: ATP-grasp domain-containing protein, partial [Allobaculum sp.]|nr:ATP-grasp domain-containing protein [Allobaculum sp.]